MEDWQIPDYPTPREMSEADQYLKERNKEDLLELGKHVYKCDNCAFFMNESLVFNLNPEERFSFFREHFCKDGLLVLGRFLESLEEVT